MKQAINRILVAAASLMLSLVMLGCGGAPVAPATQEHPEGEHPTADATEHPEGEHADHPEAASEEAPEGSEKDHSQADHPEHPE